MLNYVKSSVGRFVVTVIFIFLYLFPRYGFTADSPDPDFRKIEAVWEPLAPNNYTAGVLKAHCFMKTTPQALWRVLLNELDSWDEFVPDTLYSRIISEEMAKRILSANLKPFKDVQKIAEEDHRPLSERIVRRGNRVFFYRLTYLDFPWPLGNRWLLTREEDYLDQRAQTLTRQFNKIGGDLVRSEGKWTIKPASEDPDSVEVIYDLTADGGIHVPHFFYRRGAPKKAATMLKAIRRRAEGFARK